MKKMLGIRREDKNKWERRVPFIPEDLKELKDAYDIDAIVQPSKIRIYPDDVFRENGTVVDEDLTGTSAIFAVKEIPLDLLAAGKTYIFFSHTIKGQAYNMGLLKRLMELKCNLIDYERIVNEKNERLIFFSTHAGYAGIIETLFAFSQKMKLKGIDLPLAQIKQAFEYTSLEDAKEHIKQIGCQIAENGLPEKFGPLVVGFAGDGNVSRGAQEIMDLLPVKEILPGRLDDIRKGDKLERNHIYKVVFKEQDMVKPLSGDFDLQDYYDHPEKYESKMELYLPQIDILVNCIYWTARYPRLVTKAYLQGKSASGTESKLLVIGDISCDIEGSIEITKAGTMPDKACFTYFPESDAFKDGVQQHGITVMAIDNLPCEFPKESSMFFSHVLKGFADDIVCADFSKTFDELKLPYPIKKALILHNGNLSPDYKYLEKFT